MGENFPVLRNRHEKSKQKTKSVIVKARTVTVFSTLFAQIQMTRASSPIIWKIFACIFDGDSWLPTNWQMNRLISSQGGHQNSADFSITRRRGGDNPQSVSVHDLILTADEFLLKKMSKQQLNENPQLDPLNNVRMLSYHWANGFMRRTTGNGQPHVRIESKHCRTVSHQWVQCNHIKKTRSIRFLVQLRWDWCQLWRTRQIYRQRERCKKCRCRNIWPWEVAIDCFTEVDQANFLYQTEWNIKSVDLSLIIQLTDWFGRETRGTVDDWPDMIDIGYQKNRLPCEIEAKKSNPSLVIVLLLYNRTIVIVLYTCAMTYTVGLRSIDKALDRRATSTK